MLVQDFLCSFPTPEAAIAAIRQPPHNVSVVTDGKRALFNYDLDTPKGGMYDECRGLMLTLPTFDVLSMSFKRFYNSHEGHAAPIDWDTAVVEEKIDGSLITFYHDGERWTFHTRGTLDAEGELPARGETFASRIRGLVKQRTGGTVNDLFADKGTGFCFVCEYVGPYNRIVTRYDTEDLYLLTVTSRNDEIHKEWSFQAHNMTWQFNRPQVYDLPRTLEALQVSLSNLPPLAEGYVVRDGRGNRIKVKNPSYLALHHAINAGNAPTDKNFARLALIGDTEEIKGYFPEFKTRIEKYERRVAALAIDAESMWLACEHEPTQKDFALAVKDTVLAPWLFFRRAGKTTLDAREWMREHYRPERLVEIGEQPNEYNFPY